MKNSWAHNIILSVAVLYTVFLTWGSLTTAPSNTLAPENFDKVLHFTAYFGLTILWLVYRWKRERSNQSLSIKGITWTAVLIVGYGIIIEILQGRFTVDRIADGWDVLANSLGVLLGVIAFIKVICKSERVKSFF